MNRETGTVPQPSRPKRINERKREQTRAALLDAAMQVIARAGPDAATVDAIIQQAAVSRGTFYNYFESPETLLTALATKLSDELLAHIGTVRLLPDPADRMACSVRTFIRTAAADRTWGWVIVRIALVAAPLGATMRAFLTADIEEGRAARRFTVPSIQVAADIVLGSALMGMRSVLRGEAGISHAEAIASGILRALGADDPDELVTRPLDADGIAARSRP
ncbi:MAG: TetR/AcrR family transcriptional regulator [Rhodospirillales bacterium]|nr:TetR/AcrR family transcriptional regulator [Rhodospirillales bacterium]